MVYEEHPEWKKLLKEKKYKEATEALMREIGINLMRVHNLYSDNEFDVYKYFDIAFGPNYGTNKDGNLEKNLKDFSIYSADLMVYHIWLIDVNNNDEKEDCKYIIHKILTDKKKIVKCMKRIEER